MDRTHQSAIASRINAPTRWRTAGASRLTKWIAGFLTAGAIFVASQNGLSADEPPRIAANTAAGATWSQWRGAERDGKSLGVQWPERLTDEHLHKLWTVELQPSYSGPIAFGDKLFTTETMDEQDERVSAYDRVTGRLLWEQKWAGSLKVPFFARSNGSWIRATPACDGESLYVAGIRDVLVSLNAETGSVQWRVDFVEKFQSAVPAFGFVSSPLIDGDDLFVQAGGAVVKLDKRTGDVKWRTAEDGGGMNGSAFSSPIIATIAGERQLIVQTREKLLGLALDDGRELWSQTIEAFRGMNILTPTVWNDQIFTSSYGGKAWTYALQKNGSNYTVSEKWQNKVQAYMSSPLLMDGHLYIHLRNKRLTCLNAETGEERWTTQPFGEYWSMLAQGDRILALDERGELLLIRANPEKLEMLDRRQISQESAWAHLGNDGDQLFVRDLHHLTVYQWR